jgi:hypothetical protein
VPGLTLPVIRLGNRADTEPDILRRREARGLALMIRGLHGVQTRHVLASESSCSDEALPILDPAFGPTWFDDERKAEHDLPPP